MRFVIVTGMSGGGKSTAMKMLEDAGYYCADNMPVPLIEKFMELLAMPDNGIQKVALGLDVATYFDVNFSDEDVKRLEESDKKEADFLANAIRFVKKRGFDAYCTVIDCMAVAYAIDPTLVETMEAHVGVETKDGLTLGMTVIDRRHHFVWEQLPLIQVGCSADCGRFLQMLLELVLK